MKQGRRRRRSPDRRIFAADEAGIDVLLDRFSAVLADLEPGESLTAYAARRHEVVRENTERMVQLVKGADAFDVVELMRLRETPLVLDGYRESLSDQLIAAAEVVALLLLARGTRSPERAEGDKEAYEVVPELHDRAGEVLRIGTFSALAAGSANKYGPLTYLAAQYCSHEINVKSKQYAHLGDYFNAELFGSSHLSDILLDSLGFTYEDLITVREGIRKLYLDKFFRVRDTLGEVADEWDASRADSPERLEEGRAALLDMLFYPGTRASFTARDVSELTSIKVERVEAILDRFSILLAEPTDPVPLVEAYLDGNSPFRRAALVSDTLGNHITVNVSIGTDCFRYVVEDALKGLPTWKRYEHRRTLVSEGLAVRYLEGILRSEPEAISLKYFRSKPGIDAEALRSDARGITAIADQTEADALFVIEDVAICVEVKGRSVSSRAREGYVQRLARDLKTTVGEATDQALRLETLIERNHGLWLEDHTWFDLSNIREVRSIVVCLDDIGPLGTALDELVRAGVIREHRFPWIVSLHDLAVISEVIDRPAEFLLYLRRRTESDVSRKFYAIDELDLFMLFLNGQLYVEPDPDTVYNQHPTSGKPTEAMRRRYRESSKPTRVGTHTDPLDAWVYFHEGASEQQVEKPRFASNTDMLKIIDFLQEGNKPGWFRFSADLLNLASDAQKRLTLEMKRLVALTRADHSFHSLAQCYAGAWGFPSLFLATCPAGMSAHDAGGRLIRYMIAKKHQLGSDRALGVLLDEDGQILVVRYANEEVRDDPDLDELGKAIGLVPVERMRHGLMPYTRRPTKRLKSQKRKQRKRKPRKR